jgi:nitroimidazol reductase NimA-like FMN-containing flavoprotein (pyridoxamine 5'-phosphate oxidase superfamily)
MTVANPGDLGRRVAARREELGLSREEVAERAGMDPGYLQYLEERPATPPSASELDRLARALSTTLEQLEGAGWTSPPGAWAPPGGDVDVEVLSAAMALELLSRGGVGRVVFTDDRGPVALPVNFRLLDGTIVFRTGPGSILRAIERAQRIGFEVDRLDDVLGEGWSVVATGEAEVVSDPEERTRIDALHIHPWTGSERPTPVRLAPKLLTGRRIRRSL